MKSQIKWNLARTQVTPELFSGVYGDEHVLKGFIQTVPVSAATCCCRVYIVTSRYRR